MSLLLSSLRPAIGMTAVATLFLGLAYPLATTAVGGALFPTQAAGSLIERDGAIVGSALIGQDVTDPHYLIGRPSAVSYDAANSGGSNLGPTSRVLIDQVTARVAAIRALDDVERPPVDRVTASASGLDPHLRPESALQQAARIARLRGADPAAVRGIIAGRVEGDYLGFIGDPVVNVLLVNLDLDAAFPPATWPAQDAAPPPEAAAAHE